MSMPNGAVVVALLVGDGLGLFGTAIAMLALTLALLWGRRWALAALVAASLAGIVVMAGHGPPLMPILWLAVAALCLVRGVPASPSVRSSSP